MTKNEKFVNPFTYFVLVLDEEAGDGHVTLIKARYKEMKQLGAENNVFEIVQYVRDLWAISDQELPESECDGYVDAEAPLLRFPGWVVSDSYAKAVMELNDAKGRFRDIKLREEVERKYAKEMYAPRN